MPAVPGVAPCSVRRGPAPSRRGTARRSVRRGSGARHPRRDGRASDPTASRAGSGSPVEDQGVLDGIGETSPRQDRPSGRASGTGEVPEAGATASARRPHNDQLQCRDTGSLPGGRGRRDGRCPGNRHGLDQRGRGASGVPGRGGGRPFRGGPAAPALRGPEPGGVGRPVTAAGVLVGHGGTAQDGRNGTPGLRRGAAPVGLPPSP